MKNLIVCLTLACLASLAVAQAGESKSTAKTKAAAAKTTSAKAGCSENTGCGGTTQTSQTSCTEKSSCCANEKVAKKVSKPAEKGATFLVKR